MCPICEKTRPLRAENKAYPFCSSRCQLIDLGNWLDGSYKIADDVGEFSDRSTPMVIDPLAPELEQ